MRSVLAVIAAAAVAASPAPGGPPSSNSDPLPPLDAAPTLFRNVHVITADGGPMLRDHSVLTRDGRIDRIAPATEIDPPPGAAVVEGAGRVLVPGLCDLHVHLPPLPGDDGDGAWRAVTLLLANGVTTARGMIGHETHLELRSRVARGTLLGPTIHVAGPPVTAQSAPTPEAAAAMVEHQAANGFDFIKSHRVISPAIFDAARHAAAGAGIPVTGHVDNEVGLAHALGSGLQIEHLDGYFAALLTDPAAAPTFGQIPPKHLMDKFDTMRIGAVAGDVAGAGAWSGPTMALFRTIALSAEPAATWTERPELKYIVPQARAAWAKQRQGLAAAFSDAEYSRWFIETRTAMLRALRDRGGRILACSDSPQMFMVAGFALHDELRAMVDAGLTPRQALDAATANAAAYFAQLPNKGSALGIAPDFGAVAPGRRADLLLLRADPTENIDATRAIDAVMIRGKLLDRAALDEMLARVEASASAGA